MATRNIVPRGNGEGQLGTAEKHWAKLFADAINNEADLGNNASLGYRRPNTTYTAGQIAYHSALPTGYYLECTTAGTTSAGEITPSSTIGDTVSDGTVTWTVMKDLPLSGGDMVGADVTIGKVDANGILKVRAGTNNGDSGELSLFGKNSSNVDAGGFMLSCGKSASGTYRYLIGLPDGSLSWGKGAGETDLAGSAIVAKSLGTNGYIKYASGLIVQWGWKNDENRTWTYPIEFTNHIVNVQATALGREMVVDIPSISKTSSNYRTTNAGGTTYTGQASVYFFAIGY